MRLPSLPEVNMNAETMAAAVITAPGEMRVERVPLPEPGPGEVRIRLEGCGVCASNLGPWSGPEWMSFPLEAGALGHEGWGHVDALGPDVNGLVLGQRVAALSYKSYAEFDIAGEQACVPLPPALAGQAFPGEPLGCAMNIFARADVQAGQMVAIVGAGFLGTILTRLASDAGATVIAISRRDFALDLARRYGAAETIRLDSREQVVARVDELTGGRLCERVIEAVGSQAALDLATELTGERGRLIVAGYHQDGPRQVNMWLWNWRGIDVINAHERDPARYAEGIRRAIDAVVSGRLDPAPLYTHSFPLDQLGAALDATRDRPDGFLKALVTFA